MDCIDYTNDPRSVLIHFNPNHDKLGRFAKSPFGGNKTLKSVDKSDKSDYNKDKINKYATIGAVALAGSLAVIGGVYLVKSGKLNSLIQKGKSLTDDTISVIKDKTITDIGGGSGSNVLKSIKNTGKSPSNLDLDMISRINGPGLIETERRYNCAHTSLAYILNSMFGQSVIAKPFSGVDEHSGFVGTISSDGKLTKFGRDSNIFKAAFDGLEYKKCNPSSDSLLKVLSEQPSGTGIIRVVHRGGGHFMNYEKDKSGMISIIDGQSGDAVWGSEGLKFLQQAYGYAPADIIDFTKAELKTDSNAILVLKSMIEKSN